jgi:probable HAF family extracellular repeat protein
VVGVSDLKTGFPDAFLWNGKTMVDLGAWTASGINDLGQIAGTCGPNPGAHACLYNNGTLTAEPNQLHSDRLQWRRDQQQRRDPRRLR